MRPRHAVLLTPSISLRPVLSPSRTPITRQTPLIPSFVFKVLRTLPSFVSRKSCSCHSYANCRGVYQQFPFWNSILANQQTISYSLSPNYRICHTSENSPVSPIIATDPKTHLSNPCICHTSDTLPPGWHWPLRRSDFHTRKRSNDSSNYPLSSFFSYSCALFCTILHAPKNQPFCFQWIPRSLPKTTRGGGTLRSYLLSFLQLFRRSTRHPAIMSCSACFFSVNPAMTYPISAGTMMVIILPNCLPVERPKLTPCPAISVTTRPNTFFPTVACHSELAVSACYSQVKTRLTVAPRKISPTSVKMPTSFKSSLRVISPRNPLNPVRKISGINIKTKPKPITALSMRSAKNRNQNPAYSTRDTAAYPTYAGLADAPPPTAAVTDVFIIGARGDVGVTTNACPQLEQNAASSAIAPPHLEQYTASPSLNPGGSVNSQICSQMLLSSAPRVNPRVENRRSAIIS